VPTRRFSSSAQGVNLTYLNEAYTWHARTTISDLICLHPNKRNVAEGFWLPARWPWQGQPSSSIVEQLPLNAATHRVAHLSLQRV
jgi:hypothetical protein